MIDFRTIGPGTSIESLHRLLAEAKEGIEAEAEIEGDEESYSNLTKQQLDRMDELSSGIDQMADYLNRIQNSIDKAYMPILKESITAGVTNYKSAYDCTMFMDKYWFSNLFLSIDGKVELARIAYEKAERFCKSNLETFRMIKDRDHSIILFISYPRDRN